MASSYRPRVLVATNHLQDIAGSEVVSLEIADYFSAIDCRVTVFANWIAPPMEQIIASVPGVEYLSDPQDIRPFHYDIAYVQHQVLGLFEYGPSPQDRDATHIVAGRLSRRSYLESGGWLHDRILVDHVFANSLETAAHLTNVGCQIPMTVFHNAAPAVFFQPFSAKPAVPSRILVVTNRNSSSLLEAVNILRQSAQVTHLGQSGNRVERVTPQMIAATDLVISIGKTIPYALASRVPVYVYDHFGGPGYLDAGNVERAARFNFSGRCCEHQMTADDLAHDVLTSYAKGVAFARDVPQEWLDRFYLPRYLDIIRCPPPATNEDKRRGMVQNPFLAQERLLAQYVRDCTIAQNQRQPQTQVQKRRRGLSRFFRVRRPEAAGEG